MRIIRNTAGRNWPQNGLLPLLVLLMEVFWFYPWLVWLGRLPFPGDLRTALNPVSVLVLIGSAFLVTRFFSGRHWHPAWVRLAVVAIGLMMVFVVLPVEYRGGDGVFSGAWFGFISQNLLGLFTLGRSTALEPVMVALWASLYLWWRGIRWGRSDFRFEDIYQSFLLGAVALVVLGVLWDLSLVYARLGSMLAVAGIWVAGFFSFGLLALALGNFQAIRQRMAGLEKDSLFGRRWLVLILAVVLVVILLGTGLASLFSRETAAVLGDWLDFAANGLLLAFYYILVIPVGYILAGLAYVWHFLLSLFSGGNIPPPTSFNATAPEPPTLPAEGTPGGVSPVILTLKWAALALVAAAVIYLLARAVKRAWSTRPKDEIEEIHESLWSRVVFRAELRLLWRALRRRFVRKRRPATALSLPSVHEDEVIPDYPDVRAIYRRLLLEGEVAGLPRRTGETPAEYARRLEPVASAGKEELGYLTELYQRARYGEAATPSGMLAQANRKFKGLCRRLRALREMAV